jgi:O-acetylserine/cysteine efflux transporter
VLLAPVVAMASAWLLLEEVPTPAELLGGAVLVVGVLIALRPTRPAVLLGEPLVASDATHGR